MLGKEERRRNLTITILSLSLLTVMAGAAVAPALGTFLPAPYAVAAGAAALLTVWSVTIKGDTPAKHAVIQEK